MSDIAPMLVGLGFFTMVGWIVHVIVDGRRRRERIRVFTEFHARLLDRIGSAREFGEFLQTEGGARFLDSLSLEGTTPKLRILRSLQTGIVLLTFGAGCLVVGRTYQFDVEGFTILGTLTVSLSIGFIAASAVAYRLSKTMGLLTPLEEQPQPRRAA